MMLALMAFAVAATSAEMRSADSKLTLVQTIPAQPNARGASEQPVRVEVRLAPPADKPARRVFGLADDDWQALGSMATALLALVIFLEAKALRRIEWTTRLNQLWNGLNHVLAEAAPDTRVGDILNGVKIDPPITSREAFILFQFFNVVSTEYTAMRAKLLVPSYAIDSFIDTAAIVRTNPWLVELIEQRGWESSFVAALKMLAGSEPDATTLRARIRQEIRNTSLRGRLINFVLRRR